MNAPNGVSLVQKEGQVYCLVGESGSGKSTLALSIMGLLPNNATIEQGAIYFDGVNLLSSGPHPPLPPVGRVYSIQIPLWAMNQLKYTTVATT